MTLCPNCNKNKAIQDKRFGILPCVSCRQLSTTGLKHQQELTTDFIKNQRREFKPDMLQPWREGKLSKEYLKHHGTKGINVTPDEVAKAQNVWNDYYED